MSSREKPIGPTFTPKVLKTADMIRKAVRDMTLNELIALRESLSGDFPIDPLAGVREPRNPLPSDLQGGVDFID